MKELLLQFVQRQAQVSPEFDLDIACKLIDGYDWQDPGVNGDINHAIQSIEKINLPVVLRDKVIYSMRVLYRCSEFILLDRTHPFWSMKKEPTKGIPSRRSNRMRDV